MTGLLEKKILEVLEIPEEYKNCLLGPQWINAQNILNLLAEAKKDFPIVGWRCAIKHDLTTCLADEAYEWFVRWFGA